jgi:hypothetical protein
MGMNRLGYVTVFTPTGSTDFEEKFYDKDSGAEKKIKADWESVADLIVVSPPNPFAMYINLDMANGKIRKAYVRDTTLAEDANH